MKVQNKRRVGIGGVAALAVGLVAGAAPSAANASETWSWSNSFNCGSSLILTSAYTRDDVTHYQTSGSTGRQKAFPLPAGVYNWTYYNSGFTSVTYAQLTGIDDIDSGSRSCD